MSRLNWSKLYECAMRIADERSAELCLDALVRAHMGERGCARAEAEVIQRSNLGYFAGYYDHATRARVERLFQCEHPVFGAIAVRGAPTAEEAFELGRRLGESMRRPRC